MNLNIKCKHWGASLVAQTVKNLPAIQKTQVQSLGQEDALEKGMATHSSILAWRIPWTEEPGGLQSMGWQRVRHSWAMDSFTFTFQNLRRKKKNLRRGWRQDGNKCVWKSNVSDSYGDNLGHLDLPILSVILHSNFARCYHWWWAAAGEWGKGTWDFSVSSVQFSHSVVSDSLRPRGP